MAAAEALAVAVALHPAVLADGAGVEAEAVTATVTTTLVLSSSQQRGAPTTRVMETNAHSDVLSQEDAEPKLSASPREDGPSSTGSGPFSFFAASVAALLKAIHFRKILLHRKKH